MPPRRQPVLDASAWRGDELAADDTWVRRFSAAELDELAAAVAAVEGRALRPFQFGAADFPLPQLAPVLHAIRDEVEHGRGLKLLRGLDLDGYTHERIDLLYAGIGVHLGRVITQNSHGARIGEVTYRGTDYAEHTARGHTSNGELPPHSDSGDLVALLCVESAAEGGESRVASATTVFNLMLEEHPEYLDVLSRGFRINLAGKGPTGRRDECSHNVIPVFSYHAGRLSCRFNAKQILDAQQILGRDVSQLERDAIAYVAGTAMRDGVRLDMDFRRGDIQLLSNHSVLHARAAFRDPPGRGGGRLLLRMWINTPVSRPLAAGFADRLNTGPRGEVAVLHAPPAA